MLRRARILYDKIVAMGTWLSELPSLAMEAINQVNIGTLSALFSIASLMEVGVPFPFALDSVLFYLGYQISTLWGQAALIVFVLLLGRVVGSSVVYWLSRAIGRPPINWLRRRFPAFNSRIAGFLQKLGNRDTVPVAVARLGFQIPPAIGTLLSGVSLTVAIARITPGLLTVTSIVSGTIGFSYPSFVLGVGMASLFTDGVIIASGITMGYVIGSLGFTFSPWFIVAGLALFAGIGWLLHRSWRSNKPRV